jgi:hypothetical protein
MAKSSASTPIPLLVCTPTCGIRQRVKYVTIDNPLAEAVGDWTMLTGINNSGQIVGHYNTIKNVPWEEYQFLYDNGTFTPIAFPGAEQTHIEGFNNNSQMIGWYEKFSSACSMCVFLFDDGHYFGVSLPLPANAPRPDGIPSGNASLGRVGGLNDNGQFVGTYYRIAEWGPDPFHPGEIAPTKLDIGNFVATPAEPTENPPPPPAEPEQPIYAAKDQAKIDAAQAKLDAANEQLEAAEQSNDPKQITKAAKALASAQKNLDKAIQTAEKNLAKALAKAAKAAEKAARDEARRLARAH